MLHAFTPLVKRKARPCTFAMYLSKTLISSDDVSGNTFVADCLLREAAVLETLVKQPHPSIVKYFGCVVKEERISHLCLQRCLCNLTELRDMGATPSEQQRLLDEIRQGIEHLHNLGLAHNDINPGKALRHAGEVQRPEYHADWA